MKGLLPCLLVATVGLTACRPRVPNASGRPPVYEDPSSTGRVAGVGVESNDIVSMTDQMMRDMLAQPLLANHERPPRVIVDAEYFHNESANRLNVNSITDRLRVELNRAAAGRMIFVARHYSDMVESERARKRSGAVDTGSKQPTKAAAGGDYRLGGRVSSVDAIQPSSGAASRYNLIVFEMVDLETGVIVWGDKYEFKKSAADDVIYR